MSEFVLNDTEIAWQIVDEEVVLIHITTSFYFSINRSGTFLWNRLNTRPYSSDELAQTLSSHYHIDEKIALPATQAFIDALLAEDLIVEHEPSANNRPPSGYEATMATMGYEKPILVKYERLENVLVSGE